MRHDLKFRPLPEKAAQTGSVSGPTPSGLVQIYTGEGKGKTTAALGNGIRALGHGLRVHITFFLKGDYPYGERDILSKLPNITIASFGEDTFIDPQNITPEQIDCANQAFKAARQAVLSGDYDMVILDEINLAAAWKMVPVEDVIQLVKDKPGKVELILTGRLADPRLIEIADLVTEMVKIKHPFDKGRPAQMGVEY